VGNRDREQGRVVIPTTYVMPPERGLGLGGGEEGRRGGGEVVREREREEEKGEER
jgi:hypothetical protein